MHHEALLSTSLDLQVFSRGKVRDTYYLGEDLLMVATDRLSAFDVNMQNGVPGKGSILTGLARMWFARTNHIVPNHLCASQDVSGVTTDITDLSSRSMVVRRAERIDVECVVRGYLTGSGWAEYIKSGTLAEEVLPADIQESEQLARPAFTPAAKNDSGHDVNISRTELANRVGLDMANRLETMSINLYDFLAAYALDRGIIVADTKFEFGMVDGNLTLIDEVGTPDSSRFWPADDYEPGRPQLSFDKQPLRDYLSASGWDKNPPGPLLPDVVIEATRVRYVAAYDLLT